MSILVIGQNSYVTAEEANTFVNTYYLSTDPIRLQWDVLSSEDREVLLARSLMFIECLPYNGAKTSISQKLQFPRNGSIEVPENVKRAQIVEALSDFDPETIKYRSLKQNGIRSFTIGGLTEMFFKSSLPGEALTMLSSTSRTLLKGYLVGGFDIC